MDELKSTVIGYPVKMGVTSNAMISVVGLFDEKGGFTYLPSEKAKEIFKPDGKVFAHNLLDRNEQWGKKLLNFHVIPKKSYDDDENHTLYIWDYNKDIMEYGCLAQCFPDNSLSWEDNEVNHQFIEKNGLEEGVHYIISCSELFKISGKSGLIKAWDLNHDYFLYDDPRCVISIYGNSYVMKEPKLSYQQLDNLSDLSVLYWFKNIINNNNLELYDILKGDKKKDIYQLSVTMNISHRILRNRINKVINMFENMEITKTELNAFKNSPIFSDAIDKAILRFKDDFTTKIKEEINSQIKERKDKLEEEIQSIQETRDKIKQELKSLEQGKSKKKEELDSMVKTYQVQEKKMEELSAKKQDIVSDFNVIKEVLSLGADNGKTNPSGKSEIHPVYLDAGINEYEYLEDYQDAIKDQLGVFGLKGSSSVMASLILKHQFILVPDVRLAYATVNATGRCYSYTSYAEVGWQSFDDMMDHGLAAIMESCHTHADIPHFLIIQNINISYVPTYLQPLLDAVAGYVISIPGTDLILPENLRIIGIVTPDTGLPIPMSCLRIMGCYPKDKIFEIEKTGVKAVFKKYLSLTNIDSFKEDDIEMSSDEYYKSYIADDGE